MRFVPPKAATVRRVAAPYEFKISPLHYSLLLIAFIIGETTPSVSACAEPAPLAGAPIKVRSRDNIQKASVILADNGGA